MSGKANGADLERTQSYTWPSAHVGHLNPDQRAQLEKFKTYCEERGYYVPASDKTAATHDDETLLRYLRARKFIPEEAFQQFKDTEDWRKDNDLDNLYETIDIDEYESTRRLYPQWTGRRDKRGIPFYVYEINQVDAKAVSAYSSDKDSKKEKSGSTTSLSSTSSKTQTPRKMLRLFALYENLCRFVLPLCSVIPDRANSETPVSQSSNLVDLSKVGFAKFWSLRNHMSDASNLATAHYPETLDRIFVVGAPSFFPTVWEWAKRWFDPITVSKIFILSDKNMRSTLERYVDLDNVPKKYGGNLDWEFGDMPKLDPGIAQALQWKEEIREKGHRTLPIGPIKWQYDEQGDLVATAIGSEAGKRRERVIAGLHPEAGLARLALSPGRQSVPAEAHLASASGAAAPLSPAATRDEKKTADEKKMSAPADYMRPEGGESEPQEKTESGNTYLNYHNNSTSDADLNEGKDPEAQVPATSRAGTEEILYREDKPPSYTTAGAPAPTTDHRQGTSSSRYEQQEQTHAAGQLASGTPETKTDSQGEKQGIMEPGTVGQAPKKHPMPTPPEDKQPPPPSYMEQAQGYASAAVEGAKSGAGVVLGKVGVETEGMRRREGEREERRREEEKERRRDDPEVEGMEGGKVEEFLRAKTGSVADEMKR